jgi:hypothetical protein
MISLLFDSSAIRFSALLSATGYLSSLAIAAPADYFRIDVVDADTGRGVPLVELKTTSQVSYFTDSNGIVAIDDPELMGQRVYFSVKSHGYSYPKDMFGNSGEALDVKAGGRQRIKIKRENIAERLYRITGSGIYRDSLLVGASVPIKQPLLNGLVMGQDTVDAVPYKGKIFWLWGDTNKPSYPLGNFFTSSATSLLPSKGGLDPDRGVDLTYFVDSEGFSKKMIPMAGDHPVWMGGLFTMADNKGQERLFGPYAQVESDSKTLESGLAVFNDEKAVFEKVAAYDTTLRPEGRPFRATVNGKSTLYFHPTMRTLAEYAHLVDPRRYETYTCLKPGTKFQGKDTQLERDAAGRLVYGWKANTAVLDSGRERELVKANLLKPTEALFQLHDAETDALVDDRGGSVYWNAFRRKWVRITGQANGSTSVLGEIWYAEADTATGPWAYARKILTHDNYTFYNVAQHPFFDQDGGRLIYFEGTYTSIYSGNKVITPRYDYNQIMYRLALDDSRLALPIAIYHLKNGSYTTRDTLKISEVEGIPFFGMPSMGDAKSGLIPVYGTATGLYTTAPAGVRLLFYAMPALAEKSEKPNAALVPLYEYSNAGMRWYSTNPDEQGTGVTRTPQPLVRVWRNPSTMIPLDESIPTPGV